MKISAHTFITNPLSAGYFTYLAAIQGFLDFADEVIVVDGGSTDESLARLWNLREAHKLKIVSNELSHWGPGDLWERAQFGINREIGYSHCTGDWAICFESDHVLPEWEHERFRAELEHLQDRGVLYAFPLIRSRSARMRRDRKKMKRWCLNKRLIDTTEAPIVWGLKDKGGANERPVYAVDRMTFDDPDTGFTKYYWTGPIFPDDGVLVTPLHVYDDFFLTEEQQRAKLQRFVNMRARWADQPPKTMTAAARPYDLVSPEEYLSSGRHSRVFAEVLRTFVAEAGSELPDIYGLRRYRLTGSSLSRIFRSSSL